MWSMCGQIGPHTWMKCMCWHILNFEHPTEPATGGDARLGMLDVGLSIRNSSLKLLILNVFFPSRLGYGLK